MGRLVSLVILANVGLIPVSQALAGALSSWNVSALFALSGAGMLLLGVWLAIQSGLQEASIVLSGAPVPSNQLSE
jgi:hypothetical protein